MKRGLLRLKPYKAATPEATVQRIQGILRDLGLQFVEHRVDGNEVYYSYCLRLAEEASGQPFFQTMGKGTTDAYARASAYGEMIERLQNLAFYTMLKYPSEPETGADAVSPFKYFSDERLVAGRELSAHAAHLFRDQSVRSRLLDDWPRLAVPFWNMFEGRPEYLPFRAVQIIVGSNGMCSGNTKAEALIHGICEVFERSVLKRMFTEPFCPPDVPIDLFAGHDVHERMLRLAREQGHDIHVKDCSLGNRIPVLGLLVTSRQGQYAFHLGSDPSPVTAVERCLTEMLQGGRINFKDTSELPGDSCNLSTSEFWRRQLHLNIRSYEGHWPEKLLSDQPDYAFGGFSHAASVSDEDDLDYLLQTVRSEKRSLLVRDNSWTGFPSFHVYIPGISEMTNAIDDDFVQECLAFDRHLPALANLHAASAGAKRELAQAVTRYAAAAPSGQFRAGDYMLYYRGHPLAGMSQGELLAILEKEAPPANVPRCFGCGPCEHADRCSYSHIAEVWRRMKECMARKGAVQDGAL